LLERSRERIPSGLDPFHFLGTKHTFFGKTVLKTRFKTQESMYVLVYGRTNTQLPNWSIFGALKDLLEDSFSGTWRAGEKSNFVGLYFNQTKNIILPDSIEFYRIKNAFCWTLEDFLLKKYLFFRNSDIFKGFSFNKVLIFQEFGQN
jgi:hypothetical protein